MRNNSIHYFTERLRYTESGTCIRLLQYALIYDLRNSMQPWHSKAKHKPILVKNNICQYLPIPKEHNSFFTLDSSVPVFSAPLKGRFWSVGRVMSTHIEPMTAELLEKPKCVSKAETLSLNHYIGFCFVFSFQLSLVVYCWLVQLCVPVGEYSRCVINVGVFCTQSSFFDCLVLDPKSLGPFGLSRSQPNLALHRTCASEAVTGLAIPK